MMQNEKPAAAEPARRRIRPWIDLTIVPILLLLFVIYSFSAQTAQSSAELSDGIVERIIQIVYTDYDTLPESEQASIADVWSFLVRKTGHFTEFFLLGLFTCLHGMLGTGTHVPAYAALFSAAAAIADEVHQMFVEGRGPGGGDVLLDTAAASLAVFLVWLVIRRVRRKRREKNEAFPTQKK